VEAKARLRQTAAGVRRKSLQKERTDIFHVNALALRCKETMKQTTLSLQRKDIALILHGRIVELYPVVAETF
jgi:hypothetical protein